MRVERFRVTVAIALACAAVAVSSFGQRAAAQIPPFQPFIYSGNATAEGAPVPDGFTITAHILDVSSEPVVVENGRYTALTLLPPNSSYFDEQITFVLTELVTATAPDGSVLTDIFKGSGVPVSKRNFDLNFPSLPEPTPTPTPISPTPTETPVVAMPSVYSGALIIAGGTVPENATLVARIGEYESLPALIDGETFRSLVVDPQDTGLFGAPVEFHLNGVAARSEDRYKSGVSVSGFDLIFVGLPTPTITPTPAPTRTPTPTATATPHPTETPTPEPTPTRERFITLTPTPPPTPSPTQTPVPTATAAPSPTASPTPPPPSPELAAAQLPTPLPLATTASETEGSGGGCFAAREVPFAAGVGNALLLFAPLGFAVALRQTGGGRRSRRK